MLWTLEDVWLGGRRSPRLAGVSLSIEPGVTAVVGQSGAGKTSLLNVLVGFEQPDRASRRGLRCMINRDDHPLAIYWVPHDGGLWPHLSARAHLEYVTAGRPSRTDELLARFDLLDDADATPATLSQGQRQRLSVARCLAANPKVMVMDEPLAHVDLGRRGRYWDAIREHIESTGCSLVFASHDPATVLAEAARVICMDRGCVTFQGDTVTLYHNPPTPKLADCLGPHNWLTGAWLPGEHDQHRDNDLAPATDDSVTTITTTAARATRIADRTIGPCIRPEQLDLIPDPVSPIVVRLSRFCGSHSQTLVHHRELDETRELVHRAGTRLLQAGETVALRLVLMLLLCVTLFTLTACGGDADPTLRVVHAAYRMMPPAGPRIPAPRSIAFGPGDEMLVLDTAGRVLVFNEAGELDRQWEMPRHDQGRPEGACYLRDGRIAVADTHYYRVVFFDRDGNVVGEFGSQGNGPAQFGFPVSIVQDDAGHLYVAEYGGNDRVQKFTVEGEHLLTIGGPGLEPGRFSRPQSIVWCRPQPGTGQAVERHAAGLLFITDVEKGCLHIYSGDGDYLGLFGEDWVARLAQIQNERGAVDVSSGVDPTEANAHRFGMPYSVAVGPDQCIYVLEYENARLSKFTFDGRLLGRFGSPGRGEEQLLTPWALNVDSQNRIRIADTANARIVELVQ